MTTTLIEPPLQLKAIQCYAKIATDIERLDPIVSYWVRLYCTETALKIDKDSPESKTFLRAFILWLEEFKQTHKGNELVTNETVGQAHYENFVLKLFAKADTLDRDGTANRNTVRMFYMAACLFEAMAVFGPLNEDLQSKAKYAKFKAAYIQKCLKLGQVPKPGPIENMDLEDQTKVDSQTPSQDPSSSTMPQSDQNTSANDQNQPLAPSDPYIMTPSVPPSMPSQITRPSQSHLDSSQDQASSSFSNIPEETKTRPKSTIDATKFHATNGAPLSAEDLIKSQKYCKFANSALQYDDIPTAVANLEKALKLLKMGQHSD